MEVGGKHYKSVIVTDSEGGLIALVTDDEIIEYEDYKVLLEPTK